MTDHGGAASPRTESRAAMVLAGMLQLQYERGRLSKVTEDDVARLLALVEAAQEAPAPEGLRAIDCPVCASGDAGHERAERLDLPPRIVVDARGFYWRDYGDHYSMCPVSEDNEPVKPAAVYLPDGIAFATPPTPAEPPRPDEPVHVHVAGAGEGGAICADCGHDFRERCHARLLDETPYRCGGPQTGQPKPHTACNCTPRAEARPPEGLDAAWAAVVAALPLAGWADSDGRWVVPFGTWNVRIGYFPEDGNGVTEPHYPEAFEATAAVDPHHRFTGDTAPTPAAALLALAARLSAGGATKP